MSRLLQIAATLMVLFPLSLAGQEDELRFSGNFQDVPFQDFVNRVEEQTGVTFFYLDPWIRGIRITVSGEVYRPPTRSNKPETRSPRA